MAIYYRNGLTLRSRQLPSAVFVGRAAGGASFTSNLEIEMPRHIVPQNAGPFKVVTSFAGTPLVCNVYKGRRKVRIPCTTFKQAELLCEELNRGKSGEIFT